MWRRWIVIIVLVLGIVGMSIIQHVSHTTATHVHHAKQLEQDKLFYDAMLAYEKLYIETKNTDYLYKVGEMFVVLKDMQSAIDSFNQLKELEPKNRRAYDQLKNLYEDKESEEYIQLLYDIAFYFNDSSEIKRIENSVTSSPFSNGTQLYWHGENVVVVVENKYGIINKDGAVVVDVIYDWIGPYDEKIGFYPVRYNDDVFYIDLLGYKRVHIEQKIKEIGITSDNIRWVKENDKVIYVDNAFQTVLDNQFEDGTTFFNGLVGVKKNGKWGIIDKQGHIIIPFQYDDIKTDHLKRINAQGVIWVKLNNNWQLLNEKGEQLTHHNVKNVTPFISQEPAGVELEDGWNFITLKGDVLSNNRYLQTTAFRFGHAFVKTEANKWHIINTDEEKGTNITAQTVTEFNDNQEAMYSIDDNISYVKLFDRGKYNGIYSERTR